MIWHPIWKIFVLESIFCDPDITNRCSSFSITIIEDSFLTTHFSRRCWLNHHCSSFDYYGGLTVHFPLLKILAIFSQRFCTWKMSTICSFSETSFSTTGCNWKATIFNKKLKKKEEKVDLYNVKVYLDITFFVIFTHF